MNKLIKFFFLSLAIVMVSCSDDDDPGDTTAPVITSAKVNNNEMLTATTEVDVKNGESLTLNVTVTDNEALSQLQVGIHEAGGHEHRVKKAGEALSFSKVYDLSGVAMTTYINVSDKLDVEFGEYHLEVLVIDQKGNRREAVYEFHVE